jgi:hypothetical protein
MKRWLALLPLPHYTNIMSPLATHMGLAVSYNSKNEPYYTQDFGGGSKKHNFPICPDEHTPPSTYSTNPASTSAPAQASNISSAALHSAYGPTTTTTDEATPAADTLQIDTTPDVYESTLNTSAPVEMKPIVTQASSSLLNNVVPNQAINLNSLPRDWTCTKTGSNGGCNRWKKCCVTGGKWTCTEKWVGQP